MPLERGEWDGLGPRERYAGRNREDDGMQMPQNAGVRHSRKIGVAVLLIGLALAGCSSSNTDALKALNPDPPGAMYAEADARLANGRHEAAAKKFEDIDRQHPYAQDARRAMVLAAYAYYKSRKYPDAVAAAQRNVVMHPGTKDAALAHHVIASSHVASRKCVDGSAGSTSGCAALPTPLRRISGVVRRWGWLT